MLRVQEANAAGAPDHHAPFYIPDSHRRRIILSVKNVLQNLSPPPANPSLLPTKDYLSQKWLSQHGLSQNCRGPAWLGQFHRALGFRLQLPPAAALPRHRGSPFHVCMDAGPCSLEEHESVGS